MLQIRGHILSARFEMENKKTSRTPKKNISEVLWIGALPKGARLEWKTKKRSRKPKKQKKIRSLVDRGHPQRVLEYCFFLFSRCFFLVFSGFFGFSPRGPPQRVLEYCLFFFCFFVFVFLEVFFCFFCFLKVFYFLQGALPKESWNSVFSRVFFWFTQGFFLFSPRGPPQRVLEYCFFPHLPGEGC